MLDVQLRSAKCVVVLITRDSINSSWVNYEASVALHSGILVPVLFDVTLDQKRELPEMFRVIHVITYDSGSPAPIAGSSRSDWIETISRIIASHRRKHALTMIALSILMCLATAATYEAISVAPSLWTMERAGLEFIEWGAYSKPENDRLKSRIREARVIELLAPNATSFTSVFREDLQAFFKNKDSSMRVLFANPESDFYAEMAAMTSSAVVNAKKAREADKGLAERSRSALIGLAGGQDRIQFRQFNTEFRLPIILSDRKYCFLTVRLTPDQSPESVRLEFRLDESRASIRKQANGARNPDAKNGADLRDTGGYAQSCIRHFDAIWQRSRPYAE